VTFSQELGLSIDASVLTGLILVVEHMLVVESRLILTDAQMMFWMTLGFLMALKMWNAPQSSWKRRAYVVATAFACACAISVKWTVGVTPLVVAIVSFFAIGLTPFPLDLVECGLATVVAVAVYTLINFVHFKVLNQSGQVQVFPFPESDTGSQRTGANSSWHLSRFQGDPFMSEPFRATLMGSEWYGKFKPKGFWHNFYELTQCMYHTNKGTVTPHPYMSKWYQWPVTLRAMYFEGGIVHGSPYSIRLLVNPAVAAATVLAVASSVVLGLVYLRYRWVLARLIGRSREKSEPQFA